jgi:hypothetical protein
VIVKPGDTTLEEIIQDTKLGILVGRFSGNIDPSSGDFSGSVKGGYLIENGKKTQPLLGTMIAGNIKSDTLVINEETVWSGGIHDYSNPEAKEHLQEIRQLILDKKFDEPLAVGDKYKMKHLTVITLTGSNPGIIIPEEVQQMIDEKNIHIFK